MTALRKPAAARRQQSGSIYPFKYEVERSVFPERDARIATLFAEGWEPPAIAEQVGWPTVIVCVVLDIRPAARWFPDGELCI